MIRDTVKSVKLNDYCYIRFENNFGYMIGTCRVAYPIKDRQSLVSWVSEIRNLIKDTRNLRYCLGFNNTDAVKTCRRILSDENFTKCFINLIQRCNNSEAIFYIEMLQNALDINDMNIDFSTDILRDLFEDMVIHPDLYPECTFDMVYDGINFKS